MILKKGSVYLQQSGLLTKEEMINNFTNSNKIFTNIIRLLGWLLMFGGLSKMINPLVVIFKVVPFVEGIVGFLSGGIVLLVSLALSLLTIAIAWFAYRPTLSVVLLLIVGIIIFLLKTKCKTTKEYIEREE